MKASIDNPIYTIKVTTGDKEYDVTGAVETIERSEDENQFAQSVTIRLHNKKIGDSWLSSLITVRSRVVITANDGNKKDEVFRGFLWTRSYTSANQGNLLQWRCYDHLIYMRESEDYRFFASGKSTEDIISQIFNDWGVKMEYSYSSITNTKLVLRGNLSDILTADILDLVKDQTGKKYIIRSEKDVVKIMHVGQNSTIYKFQTKENVIQTRSEHTMEDMITKVLILGKEDKNERAAIEDYVPRNTDLYGTLQKVIQKKDKTSLADAKKEANKILDEKSKPKWKYEVEAVDVPWIRKGDKVYVNAGDIYQMNCIVLAVTHDTSNSGKTMTLTLEQEG